jgi:tetratricopeptide (TPR) repeat protein
MIYMSFPKREGQEAPAVLVDRLRSAWITTGVYLILEGVNLEMQAVGSGGSEASREEHFLVAFDGDNKEDMGELVEILNAEGLPAPTLWEESNVIGTAEQAAAFYQDSGAGDVGGAIYQRLAEALPDSYVVLSNAGRWFMKADRAEEAQSYLERAFELAPNIPEVAINLMVLRTLQKNHEAAAQILAKLTAEHPDHPAVRQMIKHG